MRTIYIKGIKKYNTSIYKGLRKSKLVEGQDYIIGLGSIDYALYWLNDNVTLKEFKKAIGANYVWKHRMRFYSNINDVIPKKEEIIDPSYDELMARVKDSIYKR